MKSATNFGMGRADLTLSLALSGCLDVEMPKLGLGAKKGATETEQAQADSTIKLIERDVEAPDVFQVTDSALWDSRPSLGGVWVAYPGNIEPERVIIRNDENKKFVIGALFKRERDNPGPKIQLSSDAAAALGILAGKPTMLNITALRRESVPDPAAVAKETASEGDKDKKSLSSIAEAAINEADSTKAETVKPAPAKTKTKTASTLDKPYIQIGIFSVETNARNMATSLSTLGVVPIVKAQESKGKKFWPVLVGTAASKSERASLLKKARSLGFDDAYFVSL